MASLPAILGLLCGTALPAAAQPDSVPAVLHKSGAVRSETISIPRLKAGIAYSLLYSISTPRAFAASSRISVEASQGGVTLVHKTLHLGDPSFYAMFRVLEDGTVDFTVKVTAKLAASARYSLQVNRLTDPRFLRRAPDPRRSGATAVARSEAPPIFMQVGD